MYISPAERGKREFNCDKQEVKNGDSSQLYAKGLVGRRKKWGYCKGDWGTRLQENP